MTNHNFNTIPVADDTEIDVYAAFPDGNSPVPGVILLQEAFGVNHHIRNVAERLCKEGYAVAAPDLFHRTGRRLEIPYTDFSAVAPHFQAITKEGLVNDLKATYDWLTAQGAVNKNKIGSIGFCLGGRVSYIANTSLPLSAAISYYGGGMDQLTDLAKDLHGPHLFFWGGKDQHITPEKADAVINAVKAAGKDYTNVLISYADHAFSCDERGNYHPLAAKQAWAHSMAFFDNFLKA